MKTSALTLTAALALAISSCGGNGTGDKTQADSTIVEVSPEDMGQGEREATGRAIDGAMNSVTIATAQGDTLSFSYPDLEPAKRVAWRIGDMLTVSYTESADEITVLAIKKAAEQ